MLHSHPKLDDLARLRRGDLPSSRARRLERHLLVCEACESHFLAAGEEEPPAPVVAMRPEPGLQTVMDRVLTSAQQELALRQVEVSAERRVAEEEQSRLAAAPPTAREVAELPADHRWLSWSVCEVLLAECRRQGFEDPPRAVELGHAALAVADRLPLDRYGRARLEDLRARCCAVLANAYRVASDFRSADAGFATALDYLTQGTGDPLELARILDLEASLRRGQRRFDQALELLDEALAIYRLLHERRLEGKALLKQGTVLHAAGRAEEALEVLRASLALVEEEEPHLAQVVRHNLAGCLLDVGRVMEAQGLLVALRRARRGDEDPLSGARLRWLEGRLALALDQAEASEIALGEARDTFLARGVGYDVALVSLDLAALYAAQGRTAELRRLAAEMLPVFGSRQVHREAMAALILFQRAVDRERVSVELVERLSGRISRSRTRRRLRPARPRNAARRR